MATTTENPWAFVDPWFRALHGLLAVADPLRLTTDPAAGGARDPETDWWLELDWPRVFGEFTGDMIGAYDPRHCCSHRELSDFVPAPCMDLDAHELRANFRFKFVEYVLAECLWVKSCVLCVSTDVVTAKSSSEMSSEWSSERERESDLVRMPQVQLAVEMTAIQSGFAIELEEFIKQLNDAEAMLDWPGFVLHSLDIDALSMYLHTPSLDALRRVVELGIPIDNIFLPDGSVNR